MKSGEFIEEDREEELGTPMFFFVGKVVLINFNPHSYEIMQSEITIYFVKYSHNPAAFKLIQFNYNISSTHTQKKLSKCDKHNLEMMIPIRIN